MARKRSKRRRNPTRAAAPVAEAMSQSTMLLLGGGILLGAYALFGGSSAPAREQQPERQPDRVPPPAPRSEIEDPMGSTPVNRQMLRSELLAPPGVEAPTELTNRVIGDNYKGAAIYYMQALPYVFGRTETLPTGESASDRALVIAGTIRRILEESGGTWDGTPTPEAIVALRTALSSGGARPTRAIPYSFTPDQAGNIYAIAAFFDPKAVNIFSPSRSI